MVFTLVLIIILSYLVGSIPFGIIVCRIWKGIDIREYGSKNAGFTNVYRVVGGVPAVVVLALDIAKGMTAVLLISHISFGHLSLGLISLKIIASLSVIFGHVFPVFAGFRGGKGIATGLGALFSIIPQEVALALILFLLIVAITRYVSLGSLSATVFILVALMVEKYYLKSQVPIELVIMMSFLTVFIFYNHRGNIKRLLAGTERKFGQKEREPV